MTDDVTWPKRSKSWPQYLWSLISQKPCEMDGSQPNLHTMVHRRARIQDVLEVKVNVKGHVIRTLLWFHENRFFSQANGWIATKLAHDGPQYSLQPRCAQGQGRGKRSRDIYGHFCDVTKCLLYSTFWRSVSTCTHFMKQHYTLFLV